MQNKATEIDAFEFPDYEEQEDEIEEWLREYDPSSDDELVERFD